MRESACYGCSQKKFTIMNQICQPLPMLKPCYAETMRCYGTGLPSFIFLFINLNQNDAYLYTIYLFIILSGIDKIEQKGLTKGTPFAIQLNIERGKHFNERKRK